MLYNIIVTQRERLTQLVDAFLAQIAEVPRDLFVRKYQRWIGIEPVEQAQYTVEYHGDADRILQRAVDLDRLLYPLARGLKFRLDEKNRQLHVFALRATEFSL